MIHYIRIENNRDLNCRPSRGITFGIMQAGARVLCMQPV